MDDAWLPTWPEQPELHVFDPEGDVLLVLERSLPEPIVEEQAPADETLDSAQEWFEPESESGPELQSVEDQVDGSASALLASQEFQPANANVILRVSSKHLILASPTFRSSLGSDIFPEGRSLRTDGHIVIPLPDEDPDAMVILMNIIHGRSSSVPRKVHLNMLYNVAMVVNHRQMRESIKLWSDTWIDNLKKDAGLPVCYVPDIVPDIVLRWLFIFWVFQKDEEFNKMALMLEAESDGTLEREVEMVCPHIPASIIQNILNRREDAIESMITIVHDYIAKYSGADIICDNSQDFSCDAKVLGSLLKSAVMIGIVPPPTKPYLGIIRKTLADRIRGMQVLDGCENYNSRYYGSAGNHGIKGVIEAAITSLEKGNLGLQLTSILPKKGKSFKELQLTLVSPKKGKSFKDKKKKGKNAIAPTIQDED